MSNSHHSENNPYFRRQPVSPHLDQPHQPPLPEELVSQPPARPQVRPPPRALERVPTAHDRNFPLHPRIQTGVPAQQPPAQQPPAQQPRPQPKKTHRPKPKVQVDETPRPVPSVHSSPPPHDEQAPLHARNMRESPPVRAPPPHPPEDHPEEPSNLMFPQQRKTQFLTWFLAIFCAIFWVVIIVGGLIVLIVYLVFRPHLPKLEIASATLNAAYLDMDALLNADMTLLINFTNPNRKVRNDLSYVILDLYYGGNPIATQYIQPFSAEKLESRLSSVHMISSQVRLPTRDSEKLKKQLESNSLLQFQIRGLVRVRSKFGSFLRYSYWLYSHCYISLTGPPTGILRGCKCYTKR
ncbi:hypothetical protein BT93_H1203 [Corymbia citriodora subsp. variegata]|nr:hypothetical protein BT93_H1203 [Corymbia citriodora subsp. variegata]